MADGLLKDYKINAKKSLDDVETRWNLHLKPFFGHRKAIKVTTQLLSLYVDQRQQEGAANASINRELAALKRMFNLGLQSTPAKVLRIPHFPHLAEDNIRTGFVENENYQKLADEFSKVGLWMRSLFECGYTFGWRISELLKLRVKQVDLVERIVRLEPGTTKNKKGRQAKMTEKVFLFLQKCCMGKNPDDYVFTRENGKPVRDFRVVWENGCKKAGLPDLLFHDLRRTAVRNMVRAGIPEHQAMKISGHKTRSIFDRYDIVNERDLAEAAVKLEKHHEHSHFDHTKAFAQPEMAQSMLPN